ncbi:Ubiquitin-related modifier 1 [Fusarium ambrosium]|uniref:Ubiquitin-related modifier 1 n=1 Tax=Fusarium ambrosium TaxID=131363 RepID=A0A428TSZ4_9HYPO|nr:Ubiquitin-related modifier 1 [Fusarium ambrosium]
MAEQSSLAITVEFSGGLEMLFSDKRHHSLSIPAVTQDRKPANIAYLIDYLCQNVMQDSRKDLFVLDNHLRPGILVLINDADWELEGEEAYEIQSGDSILFVSTLHGEGRLFDPEELETKSELEGDEMDAKADPSIPCQV